jgi:DNA-binding MarR family transcriptional regulator
LAAEAMDRLRIADAPRGLGFLIRDVSRLFSRNFERHAGALGLTLKQCRVLCYVQRHEGVSQARLAELSDTDPMTLRRLLLRLEADGWLERRADPDDRRAHRLHLRAKATPMLERIWELADCSRAEALAGFGAADRAQLMSLLGRLRDNLDAALSDADDGGHEAARRGQRQAA